MLWGLFQGNYRITKKPMTEYDARNALAYWHGTLSNLVVREIVPESKVKRKIIRRRFKLG